MAIEKITVDLLTESLRDVNYLMALKRHQKQVEENIDQAYYSAAKRFNTISEYVQINLPGFMPQLANVRKIYTNQGNECVVFKHNIEVMSKDQLKELKSFIKSKGNNNFQHTLSVGNLESGEFELVRKIKLSDKLARKINAISNMFYLPSVVIEWTEDFVGNQNS